MSSPKDRVVACSCSEGGLDWTLAKMDIDWTLGKICLSKGWSSPVTAAHGLGESSSLGDLNEV